MLIRPHAPLYVLELPEVPAPITAVANDDLPSLSSASASAFSAVPQAVGGGGKGGEGRAGLLAEALELLLPSASVHSAALASIQV